MYVNIVLSGLVALAAACAMTDEQIRQLPPKTVIKNVNLFNGYGFQPKATVVIVNGLISNAPVTGASNVIDATGMYLLPGFIDAHCHIQDCSYLTPMRQYGVTTALDMGSYPYSGLVACKAPGVTDVFGPGAAGTVNGTAISHLPGLPADSFIPNPVAGKKFVADRLAEGVDYIKLIMDPLGPDVATIKAVVQAAHAANKLVIAHSVTQGDYALAVAGAADIPCHVPLDLPLNQSAFTALAIEGSHVVPTLIMLQSIVNNTHQPYSSYTMNAKGSVKGLYQAGIPIAAGSDANLSPFVPANPPFGLSLHQELQLLVDAGVSPLNAIRAATAVAAASFRLHDRGAIATGLRADLVLLSANPLTNIANSLSIKKVFLAGVEFDPST